MVFFLSICSCPRVQSHEGNFKRENTGGLIPPLDRASFQQQNPILPLVFVIAFENLPATNKGVYSND